MQLTHTEKYVGDNSFIIMLLHITDNGAPKYQYIAIPASSYPAFKKEIENGVIEPEKHNGAIIQEGEGAPDTAIQTYMEQEFGCNHSDAVRVTKATD